MRTVQTLISSDKYACPQIHVGTVLRYYWVFIEILKYVRNFSITFPFLTPWKALVLSGLYHEDILSMLVSSMQNFIKANSVTIKTVRWKTIFRDYHHYAKKKKKKKTFCINLFNAKFRLLFDYRKLFKIDNYFLSWQQTIDSCGRKRKIFFYNFVPPLSNSLLFVLRDPLTRKSILP